MGEIVILSGSPSEESRSELILLYLGNLLKEKGYLVTHISVRDVPQADLFEGNYKSESIEKIATLVEDAQGVIVGSPVYKAAYSGVLKSLIDLLPEDVLEHKPVLPIMIGGSPSHLLAIEFALKPLLANLKGQCLKGIYFIDKQIDKQVARPKNPITDEKLSVRATKQLDYLIEKVNKERSLASSAL